MSGNKEKLLKEHRAICRFEQGKSKGAEECLLVSKKALGEGQKVENVFHFVSRLFAEITRSHACEVSWENSNKNEEWVTCLVILGYFFEPIRTTSRIELISCKFTQCSTYSFKNIMLIVMLKMFPAVINQFSYFARVWINKVRLYERGKFSCHFNRRREATTLDSHFLNVVIHYNMLRQGDCHAQWLYGRRVVSSCRNGP